MAHVPCEYELHTGLVADGQKAMMCVDTSAMRQ